MAEYLSKLSVYIVVLMVLAFLFCLTALPIKLFTPSFTKGENRP